MLDQRIADRVAKKAYRDLDLILVHVIDTTRLPLLSSNQQENSMNTEISNKTTVGELRKQYGAHFAKGYGDTDTVGQVFARAGVTTLDEYMAQRNTGSSQVQ